MAKNFRSSSIKNIDTAFLKNRALLYIILLLSLGNVYYMMVENNITFLMVFIIIGFLTSFFSKNMVVILSIAMAFTYVLRFGTNVYKLEGYENSHSDSEDEEEEEKSSEVDSDMKGVDPIVTSKETTSEVSSNSYDLNSLMPSLEDNTKIQKQILEKLSGIEKFTNGLNEYIS